MLQSGLEVLRVNDKDLDQFIKGVPFNFPLEQVLESLEDLEALAKMMHLCNIIAKIPIYIEFMHTLQGLSKAIYKLQTQFNEKSE